MSLAGAASKVAGSALTKGLVTVMLTDTTTLSAYAALLASSGTFLVGVGKLITIALSRRRSRPFEDEEMEDLRQILRDVAPHHRHHEDDEDDE